MLNSGIHAIAAHALSETAEAMDAALSFSPRTGIEARCALHLELADLTAWFYAVYNYCVCLDDTLSFEPVFDKLFSAGCYVCKEYTCTCKAPVGVENWRKIIPEESRK